MIEILLNGFLKYWTTFSKLLKASLLVIILVSNLSSSFILFFLGFEITASIISLSDNALLVFYHKSISCKPIIESCKFNLSIISCIFKVILPTHMNKNDQSTITIIISCDIHYNKYKFIICVLYLILLKSYYI